jgi:hypothetical protein
LNGEIKKKNNFNKIKKIKIKIMRTKLEKIIYYKFVLKDKIENQQNLYRRIKKKNKKKNNKNIS